MNDIKQCIHVMGEGQTLQIDFSGEAQVEKEVEPAQLKEALQKIQPLFPKVPSLLGQVKPASSAIL